MASVALSLSLLPWAETPAAEAKVEASTQSQVLQANALPEGTSGTLFTWGLTNEGLLDGSTRALTPAVHPAGANTSEAWRDIAGGGFSPLSSGSASFSCGLAADGRAFCWGNNEQGQLGDGSGGHIDDSSIEPVAVADGESPGTFTQVSAGNVSACALATDDSVYCWGRNAEGQLGNGTTTEALFPVLVEAGEGPGQFTALTSGTLHSCAIADDSRLFCWGSNDNRQLGDGTSTTRTTPVLVNSGEGPGTYTQVAAGDSFTCALGTDDSTYCWGRNQFGQIGNGGSTVSTTYFATPQRVQGPVFDSIAVSAIGTSACGIALDDSAYCWGLNDDGQLGDGTTSNRSVPVRVSSDVGFESISVGSSHTCGIGLDDTIYCWGRNGDGQLGNDSLTGSAAPVPVASAGTLSGRTPLLIEAAVRRTYLITTTTPTVGASAASTSATTGQAITPITFTLTDFLGTTSMTITPALPPGLSVDLATHTISGTPTRADATRTYTATVTSTGGSAGSTTFSLGVVNPTGALFGWGANSEGPLGRDDTTLALLPVAGLPGENNTGVYSDISTGVYHSCGVSSDDSAFCWGYNAQGQIGDGLTVSKRTPVKVSPGESSGTFRQVETGYYFSCGLGLDDSVYCWGDNTYGELGDGSTTDRSTPVATLAGSGPGQFRQITTGANHSCGIGVDDSLYCWGNNTFGQLGDGTSTDRTNPVSVDTGVTPGQFRFVTAGFFHTCAIGTDDSVYCWGDNDHGQLGDGTTTNSSSPVAVEVGDGPGAYVSLTAGLDHTCAVGTDDSVYCWGRNDQGQLGDGSGGQVDDSSIEPVAVTTGEGLAGTISVQAGSSHSCALSGDLAIYCWGRGNNGELGNGSPLDRTSPTAVEVSGVLGPVVPHALAIGGNASEAGHSLALATIPSLSLSTSEVSATIAEAVSSVTSTVSGFVGAVTFQVQPELPAGLFLSPAGTISGAPATAQDATDYTVTATGAVRGSASATVRISVQSSQPDPDPNPNPAPPFVPPAPAPSPSPTPTEPPQPTPAPLPQPVDPGQSLAVVGGEPVSLELVLGSPDRWTVRVGEMTVSVGTPSRGSLDEPIIINASSGTNVMIDGLAPLSEMAPVWVFDSDTNLGVIRSGNLSVPDFLRSWIRASADDSQIAMPTITVSEDGTLDDTIAVPDQLPPGDAVLQLAAVNAENEQFSVFFGVTVAAAEPAASILIQGSRGEVRGRPGIKVTGTTTGLVGETVMPRVRFPGPAGYFDGLARRTVAADGTFTWQRRTGKKIYVIFKTEDASVTSPRIIIRPRS